jgi:exopolyphosphatase/guanosine-5'-triphosphate,3'-diphosphate pyrophosphatase
LRGPRLRAEGRALHVRFARGWLRKHPLTQADLEQEAVWLRAAGLRLSFG